MQIDKIKIDKLIEFRHREKFSIQAWDERGLNPSSDEFCRYFTSFFDTCADKLIKRINSGSSLKQLKALLKSELASLNKLDYDTEEKEFICDIFLELATIVDVDIKDNLNKWLYGSVMTTLIKIKKVVRPERIVETLRQPCTKCGVQLETHILQKENGIPEISWFVAKCNNCGEFNLLSHGQNVKETRFGNYEWVATLQMDEYDYAQALTRLEQIKNFQK